MKIAVWYRTPQRTTHAVDLDTGHTLCGLAFNPSGGRWQEVGPLSRSNLIVGCAHCALHLADVRLVDTLPEADQPPLVQVPRESVVRFGLMMERKLRLNDHKGGWGTVDAWGLLRRLHEEEEELRQAVSHAALHPTDADARQAVCDEAADMANFAMMIAEKFGYW